MKKKHINRNWRKKIAWFNAIVIFLIPLIVFYKRIEISEELKVYFNNVTAIGDFFTYYKVKILQFGALISLLLTIYFKRKEGWKFKWDRYTTFLALFSASIVISTVMSGHKAIAIFGYPERFEGAWTWISYLMFSYSVYLFIETKEDIINIIKPFIYATGVLSLIGALQMISLDLFSTNFGKFLILGSNYKALAEQLVFKFPKGTVYTTLYNSNYIGTIVAMAIPLIAYLFEKVKNLKHRILLSIIFALNIIALIGAKSTGGLIGTSIVIVLISVYYTWKSKYRVKIGLVSIVLMIAVVLVATSTTLLDRQFGRLDKLADFNKQTYQAIKDVEVDGSNLKIIDMNDEEINIYHDNKNLYVNDKNGELISETIDVNGSMILTDELYKKWTVNYIKDTSQVQVLYKDDNETRQYNIEVNLVKDGYTIFGPKLVDEDLDINAVNFIKNENALTDRGYIWNRTIPLISVLGNGSDTFTLDFLQNDITGRVNARKVYPLIVDKPHNVFLGIAVNFGYIGLLLLIGFVVNALLGFKNNMMIVLSIIGFFIAGIVNDSTIFVTYMLFIMIGISSSFKDNEEIESK